MLVRLLGSVERAEEVFQESLVTALERWPVEGMPQNPGAWLATVAKHRALDHLKLERLHDAKHAAIGREAERTVGLATAETIPDDRLRLVFTCCHPALSRESQVAITLRLVCGLTTDEIARAFLLSEPTIAQRLVRAKRTIAERRLPYEVPAAAELPDRLAAVLAVVYLVFNEGYSATTGTTLQRVDLAREAIELGGLVARLLPDEREVHALLALMELQTSRSTARTDGAGNARPLEHQDRSRWDPPRIARAARAPRPPRDGTPAGPYRLQAEIAACHASAATCGRLGAHRGALRRARPRRAVAGRRAQPRGRVVAMADGPAAGRDHRRSGDTPSLRDYRLLPSTRRSVRAASVASAEARRSTSAPSTSPENRAERAFLAPHRRVHL
jgi:RNA polymerase sigma factor (sigma-70 family)